MDRPRHRLPDFELEVGRATRVVDSAVRVILALLALAVAGGAVLVLAGGLDGPGWVARAVGALFGGGG
jgi:hypothetical protein